MSLELQNSANEGDESYFVSMTDIMVGMLFVFIILLMYFVFRIQNTIEPMVPLSEYQPVLTERDRGRIKIKELEDEIARSKSQPVRKVFTRCRCGP
jgi:hypothetical protein